MIPAPTPIDVEYGRYVILRYWVGTSNPSAWGLRFRLVDEDGTTVLIEETLAGAGITTASGTKSDGTTTGYYAQVDLGTDGQTLTPADKRYHILERTDAGSQKVHAHGAFSVTLLPGQTL